MLAECLYKWGGISTVTIESCKVGSGSAEPKTDMCLDLVCNGSEHVSTLLETHIYVIEHSNTFEGLGSKIQSSSSRKFVLFLAKQCG